MTSIQLRGVDRVLRNIGNLPKQTRFACSQALNDTAKDVQGNAVNTLLPQKFTLRSKGAPWQKPGSKFGFNIRPFATKDKLTATIGSQADWLKLQEAGGTKKVQGHRVAIPTEALKPKSEIVRRELKPARLLKGSRRTSRGRARVVATPRPFLYNGTAMKAGIYIRTGQGLRRLYTFEPSVKVRPVLNYEKTGVALAERVFGGHFQRRWVRAIATAR